MKNFPLIKKNEKTIRKNIKKIKIIKLKNNNNLKIISSSGILGIYEYLNKLKIMEIIDKIYKENTNKKGKYGDNKLFVMSLLAIIDGVSRIDDISKWISKNKEIAKEIGLNTIPSTEVIYGFFKRSGKTKLMELLRELNKKLIIENYINEYLSEENDNNILVEIDATFMKSDKKEAKFNYKKEKSYSVLLEHIGEDRLVFDFEFRDGNVHPGKNIDKMLSETFRYMKDKKILFVSDSAGYNKDVIDVVEDNGSNYIIKMKKSERLLSNANIIGTKWERYDKGTYLFDGDYVFGSNKDMKNIRVIYINNMELFGDDGICTNLDYNYSKEEIYKIYRDRAKEELSIGELKHGYSLCYVPSKYETINNFFTFLNTFGYNIIKLLQKGLLSKSIVIDKKIRYVSIKRFRLLFIDIAGKLSKSSRKLYLNLNLTLEHFSLFEKIFNYCFGFIV